jgi:hypothetical protein
MSVDIPQPGSWTGDDFSGPSVVVSVQVAEGHELSPEALAALEALSQAIAEEGDEVAGFSMFGPDTGASAIGGALNPMGGPSSVLVCGCNGENTCTCKRDHNKGAMSSIEF